MTLKKFDAESTPTTQRGKPIVNFGVGGNITINPLGAKHLGIVAGDKLTILQDDEDADSWYVAVDAATGFVTRAHKKADGSLNFNSAYICKAIRESAGSDSSLSCSIAQEVDVECNGLQCYGLIFSYQA